MSLNETVNPMLSFHLPRQFGFRRGLAHKTTFDAVVPPPDFFQSFLHFAMSIDPGQYFIQSVYGTTSLIIERPPPPDRPLALMTGVGHKWRIQLTSDGSFIIISDKSRVGQVVRKDFVAYFSPNGIAQPWQILPAGRGCFRIKIPNEDGFLTRTPDDEFQVVIAPVDNSEAQQWKFKR
ncbi:hypothetical protein GALMADRAFT_232438 [Galerina marginata CBS 339.88]|uniref:Ricin B lectin domain-containing protein n=1 Tax=Galerina marginata (strain CBS 339.88) TaxID=685588 RepID=A0A067SFR9_GALM3|nr:hypothetical protein GALMADRAFT_232438 [Galerina marginata CBS 339.88]